MNVLITGVAGTGKSSIGYELMSRGFTYFELDDYSSWYDTRTNTGGHSNNVMEESNYLQRYEWHVDLEDIEKSLQNRNGELTFLAGNSDNIHRVVGLCQKIFLLTAPMEVLIKRYEGRDHPYGKRTHEQQAIEKYKRPNEDSLIELGATVIDTSQVSIQQAADFVLDQIADNES